MDVIGCLAAFAPGDLQRLRYTSYTTKLVIVKSKFIIVFPFVSHVYRNTAGVAINGVKLIAPGSSADIHYNTGLDANMNITFNNDGQTVSSNRDYTISIAYCPV